MTEDTCPTLTGAPAVSTTTSLTYCEAVNLFTQDISTRGQALNVMIESSKRYVPYTWLIPRGESGIIYVAGKGSVPQMENMLDFKCWKNISPSTTQLRKQICDQEKS
jgi:hypothetical protein